MPADEIRGESPAVSTGTRTGPRHAAPKKPLFTRFHMPAGKAIAIAAMPTAVLMGIGFTPTLALADEQPTTNSLKADEYKDCVAALDEDGASATPSPSASSSDDTSADDKDAKDDTAEPSPTATSSPDSAGASGSGDSSSSDSGSDDEADPTPSASPSKESNSSGDTATASPSPSDSGGNLLEDLGDAVTDVLTGSGDGDSDTVSSTPSPSATKSTDTSENTGKDASDAVQETTDKVTDTVRDTTDTASKAAEDTTEAAEKATEKAKDANGAEDDATASPSPSPSSSTDAEDCPAATDAVGDVDNKVAVADRPWRLEASSLTLKGAQYKGVVEVKTASGKTKKVLKYVITDGTDIGDLHQIVNENGKAYHVQAGKGTTSTIRDGDTVMYTESISGNLYGLIPITFDPEHPPPLDIPLIYFTNVTVTQAAQFGGTLHIPGMRQYSE